MAGRRRTSARPFARTSEDRPPRVLSRITPPVLAGCARRGGPIRATRGGKPSEAERRACGRPTTRTALDSLLQPLGKDLAELEHLRRHDRPAVACLWVLFEIILMVLFRFVVRLEGYNLRYDGTTPFS